MGRNHRPGLGLRCEPPRRAAHPTASPPLSEDEDRRENKAFAPRDPSPTTSTKRPTLIPPSRSPCPKRTSIRPGAPDPPRPFGPTACAREKPQSPAAAPKIPPYLPFLTPSTRLIHIPPATSGPLRALGFPSMGQAVNRHSTCTLTANGVTASVRSFRRPDLSDRARWVVWGRRVSARHEAASTGP